MKVAQNFQFISSHQRLRKQFLLCFSCWVLRAFINSRPECIMFAKSILWTECLMLLETRSFFHHLVYLSASKNEALLIYTRSNSCNGSIGLPVGWNIKHERKNQFSVINWRTVNFNKFPRLCCAIKLAEFMNFHLSTFLLRTKLFLMPSEKFIRRFHFLLTRERRKLVKSKHKQGVNN